MADSYIPYRDVDYDQWLTNFGNFVTASGDDYGLSAALIADMTAAVGAWTTAYTAHLATRTAAQSATAAKDQEREESEALARQLAQVMQNHPAMTDAMREQAGLTQQEGLGGGPGGDVVTSPAPNLRLDWSLRGRITVHFGPTPETPGRNPLPEYARGVRLEYALGGVPAEESAWQDLVDDTRSPYVHVLAVAVPTTIAYRAQYFDRVMNVGPWSDPVEATVTV